MWPQPTQISSYTVLCPYFKAPTVIVSHIMVRCGVALLPATARTPPSIWTVYHVTLFDNSLLRRFSVSLTGTSENCLLTNYPFVNSNPRFHLLSGETEYTQQVSSWLGNLSPCGSVNSDEIILVMSTIQSFYLLKSQNKDISCSDSTSLLLGLLSFSKSYLRRPHLYSLYFTVIRRGACYLSDIYGKFWATPI